MQQVASECDCYLIDTYKVAQTGKYVPGAITFKGRKKIQMLRWEEKSFDSQAEADAFVRLQFEGLNLPEAANEGEIFTRTQNR